MITLYFLSLSTSITNHKHLISSYVVELLIISNYDVLYLFFFVMLFSINYSQLNLKKQIYSFSLYHLL